MLQTSRNNFAPFLGTSRTGCRNNGPSPAGSRAPMAIHLCISRVIHATCRGSNMLIRFRTLLFISCAGTGASSSSLAPFVIRSTIWGEIPLSAQDAPRCATVYPTGIHDAGHPASTSALHAPGSGSRRSLYRSRAASGCALLCCSCLGVSGKCCSTSVITTPLKAMRC
jgi:hypothetical protein